MLQFQREYKCCKCRRIVNVQADYALNYAIVPPTYCDNPEGCTGGSFTITDNISGNNCKDYQEIKIQVIISIMFILISVPSMMTIFQKYTLFLEHLLLLHFFLS